MYDRLESCFESVKQDMEAAELVTTMDVAQVVCDGPASVMSS